MVSTMPTSWSQTLTTALGMGPESGGTGEKHGMVDGAGGGWGKPCGGGAGQGGLPGDGHLG